MWKKVDCDTYFLLGFGNNHHKIEDLRIIPNDGWISNLATITISRNSLKTSKYDQFKVDHIQYDNVYHNLRLFLGNKNHFRIDEIKRWLK